MGKIHQWEGRRWLFSLIILVQCGTSSLDPVAGGFPSAAQPPHDLCASVTGAREEKKDGEQGQLENSEILSRRDQINNTSNS